MRTGNWNASGNAHLVRPAATVPVGRDTGTRREAVGIAEGGAAGTVTGVSCEIITGAGKPSGEDISKVVPAFGNGDFMAPNEGDAIFTGWGKEFGDASAGVERRRDSGAGSASTLPAPAVIQRS